MIKTKSSGMKEAMETVRQMSLRKELKWLFEQREKARRDRHGEDEYVRDEGRAEGIAKGIAEGIVKGRAEGIAKGRAEGIAEGRADIIRTALAAGSSPEEISRVMKIDLNEIQDVMDHIEEEKNRHVSEGRKKV